MKKWYKNVLMVLFWSYANTSMAQIPSYLLDLDYELVLNEEFTYTNLDDLEKKWRFDYPWGKTLEEYRVGVDIPTEYYDKSAVSLGSGTLIFTATKLDVPDVFTWEKDGVQYQKPLNHKSGMIFYKQDEDCACWNNPNIHGFTYGYYEIRCKLPINAGTFPAFWTYSGDFEIDVFEKTGEKIYSGNGNGVFNSNVIDPLIPDDFPTDDNATMENEDFTNYHTYGALWEPDMVTFFLDGQAWYSVPSSEVKIGSCPGSIIANLAVWDYAKDRNWTSTQMVIDYIKVYKKMSPSLVVNNSTSWNASQIIGEGFKVANNSTLTISTFIPIPTISKIIVESGSDIVINTGGELIANCVYNPTQSPAKVSMNVDGEITINNNGRMAIHDIEVNGKITVNVGGILTVQEGSKLVVNNGAQLVIEDLGQLNIEKGGIVNIKEGGVLLLKDRRITGSTGLNINGNGELFVQGTLHVADDAVLNNKGDGKIYFHGKGKLTMGTNVRVDWDMKGTQGMVIDNEVNLSANPVTVKMSNGRIGYGYTTSLHFNTDKAEIDGMAFFSYPALSGQSTALTLNSNDITVKNSEFNLFQNGLRIQQPPTTTQPHLLIENTTFSDIAGIGIDIKGGNIGTIKNCEIAYSAIGIKGSQTSLVVSKTTLSNLSNAGIDVSDVYALHLENESVIENMPVGIRGIRSNVFLRGESRIQNCSTGVNMQSGDPQLHNMLSVGDVTCAWIINNNTGIRGTNILLHADAVTNSYICPDCGVGSNRFDGNGRVATLCYESNPPSQIEVRGAYWGNINPNGDNGIVAKDKCFSGKPPASKIPVISTDNCMSIPVNCYCPISSPNPNPNPGPIPIDQALFATKCTNPDDGEQILDKMKRAYPDFVHKDFEKSLPQFEEMAKIPYKVQPGYFYSCEHLLRVAEILSKKNSDESLFSPYHPATNNSSRLSVETQGTSGNSYYTVLTHDEVQTGTSYYVYNMVGSLVAEGESYEHNRISINTETLPSGIYTMKIHHSNGNTEVAKVVVF